MPEAIQLTRPERVFAMDRPKSSCAGFRKSSLSDMELRMVYQGREAELRPA
jgi:hypothetical protein